ncbi:sensor histidine kinase [Floccifex sp.]|uniref:sensor histidine kinase n=1 Tax=Floccifex sp. TaxID=2815810 RepID=UPI003EFE9367
MKRINIKTDKRFPVSIFFVFFFILLLMSGFHTGIVVLSNDRQWTFYLQIGLPLLYWGLVAVGMTVFTRYMVYENYEKPVLELRKAFAKVINGDFSVYVAPYHIIGQQDYLDAMILDFNKMVEELGSIEVLKTDFFSNVSHEIKTPLAVIQNTAELLQKEVLTEEKRKECTKTILQASRRLSNLITNMLKLNKLEKQSIKPAPQKFDVCAQLCECALLFENQWEKKEIEFEADLEDHAYVKADEELLSLVWNNLLSNAIKFTPNGGHVTLKQETNEKNVIVSICDTGCGMDEKTQKKIFEKFYQGDSSHSSEGNGLGLALVKRILELSEASILVESEVGKGSIFIVSLPAVEE